MIDVDMVAVLAEVQRLINDPPRRGRADVYAQAVANVAGCDVAQVPRELRDSVKAFSWGALLRAEPGDAAALRTPRQADPLTRAT